MTDKHEVARDVAEECIFRWYAINQGGHDKLSREELEELETAITQVLTENDRFRVDG